MFLLKPTYTIEELLGRCRAGERKAQELLYNQLASKMLGVCMRYTNNRTEAEDMLQNGFIKVFKNINDYRGEGAFEGWVRRIMVHTSIEYYRKHYRIIQPMDIANAGIEPAVEATAITNLDVKDLMNVIQQLTPGYRMVFNLYAIEGYSHKEVAAMMGITEGTSKSQLSRARTILKELVTKMEGKTYGNAG